MPSDAEPASADNATAASAFDSRLLFDDTGALAPAVRAKLDSLPSATPRATYKSLLTLPPDFIASTIRNACEVNLLLEIGRCGFTMERLVQCELDRAGCELKIGKRYWMLQSVCLNASSANGNANEYEALLPILDTALQKLGRQRAHILNQLDACAEELEHHRRACAQFAEMNAGMAAEVARAGVPGLSVAKYILADVQWEMVRRIDALLQGRGMPAAADVEWPPLIQRFRAQRGDYTALDVDLPSHITDSFQSGMKRKCSGNNTSLDSTQQPPAKKLDIMGDISKSSSGSDRSPLIITQINAKGQVRAPLDREPPNALIDVTASCLLTSTPIDADLHQPNFACLSGVSTASQRYEVRDTQGSSTPSADDLKQQAPPSPREEVPSTPSQLANADGTEVEDENEHSQLSTQPSNEDSATPVVAGVHSEEPRDQSRDHADDTDDQYKTVLEDDESRTDQKPRRFFTADSDRPPSPQFPLGQHMSPSLPPASAPEDQRSPCLQQSVDDNEDEDDNDEESCHLTQDSYLAVRFKERVSANLQRAGSSTTGGGDITAAAARGSGFHHHGLHGEPEIEAGSAAAARQKPHTDEIETGDTDKENHDDATTPPNPYRGPTLSVSSSSPASGSRVLCESGGSQDAIASQDNSAGGRHTLTTPQNRRPSALQRHHHHQHHHHHHHHHHRRLGDAGGEDGDMSLTQDDFPRSGVVPASAVSLNLSISSSGVSSKVSIEAQEEGLSPQGVRGDAAEERERDLATPSPTRGPASRGCGI
ncbi:hypothetical protein HDU87_004516 [Geranomyces variabilis]|uniref:Uncharacterized protein n=1 Tax=Geranomyces variabilis TaxID=109894 RepID=A0AAD5TNJ8_9FUNG|nr:hypothetical protein HDU87_004516 [Geranomyces variabilis]